MKLDLDFDELCEAFEQSNVVRHYFIDTKENEIIYINEEVEDDAAEKLEKIKGERYIRIPQRLPNDNFSIMENFVYGLAETNFELAEKFHKVLEGKKPFRNFKDLLINCPKIREDWSKYKDKEIIDETINWLCRNKIELKNKKLIADIKINELKENELENLPKETSEEIRGFAPVMCLNCKNKAELKARFFLINVAPENMLVEKETKKIMKEKYDINEYGHFTGGEKELLTASKCPKCGNEDVIWDY